MYDVNFIKLLFFAASISIIPFGCCSKPVDDLPASPEKPLQLTEFGYGIYVTHFDYNADGTLKTISLLYDPD